MNEVMDKAGPEDRRGCRPVPQWLDGVVIEMVPARGVSPLCQWCGEMFGAGELRWTETFRSPDLIGRGRNYLHLSCAAEGSPGRFDLGLMGRLARPRAVGVVSAPGQSLARVVYGHEAMRELPALYPKLRKMDSRAEVRVLEVFPNRTDFRWELV